MYVAEARFVDASPVDLIISSVLDFQKLQRVDKGSLDELSLTKLRQLIRLLCKRNFERTQDSGHLKRQVLYEDVESLVTHDVDSSDEEYQEIVKVARRVLPRNIISDSDNYLIAMVCMGWLGICHTHSIELA
jgi:hypothetical protein